MVSWWNIEHAVERSRKHFASAALIRTRLGDHIAGTLDAYIVEMALRHAIQAGEPELGDAKSMLQFLHAEGAADGLLSDEVRRSHVAIRALAHAEMLEPSSIKPKTLAVATEGFAS